MTDMSDVNATAGPRVTDAARFAMSGTAPRMAWRPETAAEAAEAVRQCSADGLKLVPWGGGVSLRREAPPERYDVALDVTALKNVTIYDPEDFTVTAECGITLDDLRATLGAKQQELPLEGAESWGATLGGVLAANASGARRRTLGSPRDRILGASFVTGDGVLAKSGGRVVKNVAGHAVHRLLVGSHGGLGVLVQASLKLLPQPRARAAMIWGCDAAALADAARWRDWPRREPAALTVIGRAVAGTNPVLNSDAPFTVVAGFEEDAAWVEDCASFARRTLGTPRVKVQDASVPPLWQQLADLEEMPGVRLTFTTAANTPEAIAFLGGRSVAERLVFHAACGRLHMWPGAEEAAGLVKELAGRGFALLETRGMPGVASVEDTPVASLRQALRRMLDPARALALGPPWPGPQG
jgi:FAD/FMN-containing dehydrogenase